MRLANITVKNIINNGISRVPASDLWKRALSSALTELNAHDSEDFGEQIDEQARARLVRNRAPMLYEPQTMERNCFRSY